MNIKCTVFFEDPFWVGIFERTSNSVLEISRVVFGSEPKDYEVYAFILEQYHRLDFSRPVSAENGITTERKINPKRLQRIVRNETSAKGICTKSQQVIKMEYEERKKEQRQFSREMREESERLEFLRKQLKKKEKKKGH